MHEEICSQKEVPSHTPSQNVLAIGAHPDDVEIGCGGSIASHSKQGDRVYVAYLTRGEKSGPPKTRIAESRLACRILGTSKTVFGEFTDSNIPVDHLAIEFLEDVVREAKPEIVYTHSVNELHQDHRNVGYVSLSAFREVQKILAYESPRIMQNFAPSYFVDISRYIDLKWKALQAHVSQRRKNYMAYKSMINLASFRGRQVGVNAAEGFEVIRYLQRYQGSVRTNLKRRQR